VTELAPSGAWRPTLVNAGRLPMKPKYLAPAGVFDAVVDLPSNVLLLRGPGGTVLIDASSGSFATGWPGGEDFLVAALAAAGCGPEDVELIVLTHLDFDHCGGCLDVPRARVVAPEGAVPSGETGEAVIERLTEQRRLEWVADGGSPAEGLRLRAAPGHREGHSIVEIGDDLVHLADVVHHPAHVPHPEWDREFDSDEALALTTRVTVLGEMAGRGVTVTASHIAEPGRIVPGEDGSLSWQPV
jgi:glyoxylase-like metal-dependent hydrolase (beta-lactamase superfamily II)